MTEIQTGLDSILSRSFFIKSEIEGLFQEVKEKVDFNVDNISKENLLESDLAEQINQIYEKVKIDTSLDVDKKPIDIDIKIEGVPINAVSPELLVGSIAKEFNKAFVYYWFKFSGNSRLFGYLPEDMSPYGNVLIKDKEKKLEFRIRTKFATKMLDDKTISDIKNGVKGFFRKT
jgi:hypothetical protein